MVVRIRLARWGARNNPFFGIVVANKRAPRDGKHLERVGTFNPVPNESKAKIVELNVERIKYWLSVGAQPSDKVAFLLAKANLIPPNPKYLHKIGLLNINDKTTWNIQMLGEDGSSLGILSSQQAQMQFKGTELEKELPKVFRGELNRIDHSKLQLESISIEPKDRNLVLKAYLGL